MGDQLTLLGAPPERSKHPARYSDAILPTLARFIPPGALVLDPFAGTGRIHELRHARTVGVELEPEWASHDPRTIVGDALHLPFATGSFDVVATSPTYGNRMADHHDARDDSRRLTYRHVLGRPLHPNNSGQLQWGERYRAFHRAAWVEATRVLRRGGTFLLNVSDHVRAGVVQPVTAWHVATLTDLGLLLVASEQIETPRMRFGQNSDSRVSCEVVAVFLVPCAPALTNDRDDRRSAVNEQVDPKALTPGTVVRHRTGGDAVLDRRKEDNSGWWLRDNHGGLADFAWESGDWTVVDDRAD